MFRRQLLLIETATPYHPTPSRTWFHSSHCSSRHHKDGTDPPSRFERIVSMCHWSKCHKVELHYKLWYQFPWDHPDLRILQSYVIDLHWHALIRSIQNVSGRCVQWPRSNWNANLHVCRDTQLQTMGWSKKACGKIPQACMRTRLVHRPKDTSTKKLFLGRCCWTVFSQHKVSLLFVKDNIPAPWIPQSVHHEHEPLVQPNCLLGTHIFGWPPHFTFNLHRDPFRSWISCAWNIPSYIYTVIWILLGQ